MILNVILLLIIIFFLLIIFGMIWKHISNLHHKNYSYFDFIFIVIYFSEQLSFLLLYHFEIEYRELWVASIVLVVITTSSLDKFMMNSRHKKSGKIIRKSINEKKELLDMTEEQSKEIELLKDENKRYFNYFKKRLKEKS